MKNLTASILLWIAAVIGFVIDFVRGTILVARGAYIKGDVWVVPFFSGWRVHIHHIPYGDYEYQRMLLPLTYDFHRELHSAAPIAVIDRCKLDELITETVKNFDD